MVSTQRKTAFPDATTLIALSTEMASSMKTIDESFPHFVDSPSAKPISDLVRRISDTSRILNLRAIIIVADEVAELASRIESGTLKNSEPVSAAIKAALSAMQRYLANAAIGKISAGLVLHGVYSDLMALMPERRSLNRSELFLPVYAVFGSDAQTFSEGKFIAEIARYHDEYHQALASFNSDRNLDNINAMRTALVTMETKIPPANFRTLFSLAISFFDMVIRNGGKIASGDEHLLVRIDEELAGVVRGEVEVDEGTVSWFLHSIAMAPQFSTRIRTFQDTYELPRLADDDVAGVISEQTISNAQMALQNAQRTWESAMMAGGDVQAAKNSSFALLAVSNIIGDYAMKTMAMAIGTLADGVASSVVPLNHDTAVFGASILLAIGERISVIVQDPKGGRAIADFHRDRVRAVLAGKSTSDKTGQVPTAGLHAKAILDEVINNVSATEQIVDQCLRDGVKEVKVKEALKLFGMVRSALLLLNLDDGSKFAELVEAHVREQLTKLLDGAPADEAANLRMAEGVMLMGSYIKLILVDQPQANATLMKGMALFAIDDENEANEIPPTVLAEDLPFDVCVDEELGPIFFEEAKDVIGNNILLGLAKMRVSPTDEKALVDVRRGFHTLKGSARMVELNNLGLLGQHAEYVLNVCRDNSSIKPNTAMVEWLETVAQQFSEAIVQLEGGHRAPVDNVSSKIVHDRFMDTNVFTLEVLEEVPLTGQDFAIDIGSIALVGESDLGPDVHIPETGPVIHAIDASETVLHEPVMELALATSDLVKEVMLEAPALDHELVSVLPATVPRPQAEPIILPVAVFDIVDEDGIPPVPASEFIATDIKTDFQEEIPSVPESVLEPVVMHEDPQVILAGDDLGMPEVPESILADEPLMLAKELATAVDLPQAPTHQESLVAHAATEQAPVALALAEHLAAEVMIPESSVLVAPSSNREVELGDLHIPGVLYSAFVAEARPFYNSLDGLIRGLISGKIQVVGFEVTRLAHSLAGMGRTTGLSAITEIATEIESWASIMRDHKVSITQEQATVLRDTLEALEAMILGVEDCIEPLGDPAVVESMKKMVSDAEHFMAHGRDDAEMSSSILRRMEDGGEVTDSGVAEFLVVPEPHSVIADGAHYGVHDAHDDSLQVVLDSTTSIEFASAEQTKTVALEDTTFAETVPELTHSQEAFAAMQVQQPLGHEPMAADESLVHVIGDTVDSEPGDELLRQAVATEIASSTFQEVDNIEIDEPYAVDAVELISDPHAPVLAIVVAEPAVEDLLVLAPVEAINEVHYEAPAPAVVDAPKAEVIFVAPDVAPIPVSEIVVPQSIHLDIGTSTIEVAKSLPDEVGALTSRHAGPISATGMEGNTWLEMVRGKDDDVDPEMLEIFLDEAGQSFTEIDAALTALGEDLGDKRMFQSLKRYMHTLKGSSNTAGARKIGALFHHLEDVMTEAPVMTAALCSTVQGGVDAAFAGIEALRKGRSIEAAIERAGRAAMRHQAIGQTGTFETETNPETNSETGSETNTPSSHAGSTQSVQTSTAIGLSSTISAEPVTQTMADAPKKRSESATKSARAKEEEDSTTLRVSTKTLDRMVKTVGEVGISRGRMAANLSLSKISMTGLAISLDRMNGYLRAIELEAEKQMFAGAEGAKNTKFDALQMDRFTRLQELTRRVAEAQNDVLTHQNATLGAAREMEEVIATQNVLVSDLAGDLDQIRQVRVSSIVPALKRVVRAACRDTGKLGEIFFDADVEIDRGILDKMVAPIEHILRNAIAHGIESQQDRINAGKPEIGAIEFKAFQDGGEVVIVIVDDGCGINVQHVLSKAVEKGLVSPGAQMTEEKVHDLLFEPGFSTADSITDIAGRGVGLDVVRSQVSSMGGRVDVKSAPAQGTTFTLRMPATLTVIAGAAVTTNGHMYVVPVSFIDRLVRVGGPELEDAYKSHKLVVQDAAGEAVEYDFWGMWQLVGSDEMETHATSRNSVLLMRGSRTAVHVDDIRPAAEYVFRPMGPQVMTSSGLIGSTINTAGNAALVVDPTRVARNLRLSMSASASRGSEAAAPALKKVKVPLVLIVDDSLTVRKVTTRLLKREGLRHIEAENGMQALERLQEERPDVILMDIEMPVMNGYEATQAIRATPETADIPIIMITSRVGESHRQRAFELGVNEYLGKPYNDGDLLELIRKHAEVKPAADA